MRSSADFQNVRISGNSRECGFFLWSLLRRSDHPESGRRLGVIATKRLGNAVQRNRARRRLRELFRRHQERLPSDCDLVLVARRRILHASWSDLEKVFLKMTQTS